MSIFAGKKSTPQSASCGEDNRYSAYRKLVAPSQGELERQRREPFPAHAPRWSIICGAKNLNGIANTLEALQKQTYPRWELCVAGEETADREIAKQEGVRRSGVRQGETPVQAALRQANGTYYLFLAPGDQLREDALYHFSYAIATGQDVDLIYADEDCVDSRGKHDSPWFKPDYAPHTHLSLPYFGRMMGISRQVFQQCGGLQDMHPASQYDFQLRAEEMSRRILHVPKVLMSCRMPRLIDRPVDVSSGKRALDRALSRRQISGCACGGMWHGSFSIQYGLKGTPKISVIILDQYGFAPLRRLLESLEEFSAYEQYELIVISDGRQDAMAHRYYEALRRNAAAKVLDGPGQGGPASLYRFAASEAQGEILLFLSSSLELETPDALYHMATLAQQKNVGAVGAKIVTVDGRIWSAGTVVGLQGWAGHLYQGAQERCNDALQRQFTQIIRNVTAVSGECLMVTKEVYRQIGGFDPSFTQVGWDTEFCLRLREKGYYTVYTPYAGFIKHELSKDFPLPTQNNLMRCIDAYRPMLVQGDPYFGPQYDYHSPIPVLALPPQPPLELNPGAKSGV